MTTLTVARASSAEQRFNHIVALKKGYLMLEGPHHHHSFADLWKGYSHKEGGFSTTK